MRTHRINASEIARWQKGKANTLGKGGQTGSVTFVQRFNLCDRGEARPEPDDERRFRGQKKSPWTTEVEGFNITPAQRSAR